MCPQVDIFSFALTVLEIAVADANYVHHHFKANHCGSEAYALGWRPPIPDHLPKDLNKLIERCWLSAPNLRPDFRSITRALEKLKPALEEEEEVVVHQHVMPGAAVEEERYDDADPESYDVVDEDNRRVRLRVGSYEF